MKRLLLAALAAGVLAGCASTTPAPVVERTRSAPPVVGRIVQVPAAQAAARPDSYTVRRGDTLYSIALDNGLDYRDLASWNAITDANMIREGQVLSLKAPQDVQVRPIAIPGSVQARPLAQPPQPSPQAPAAAAARAPAPADLVTEPKAMKLPYSEENLALLRPPSVKPAAPGVSTTPAVPAAPPAAPEANTAQRPSTARQEPPAAAETPKAQAEGSGLDWGWPANGKIIAGFSDPSNKGVDIAGRSGDAVYAAASGVVRYVGTGIPSLGKLVVIKHNNDYISAYAHNENILVKEGQTVVRGQKIAEIGSSGTDQTKLHFEIRQLGKPVDPLKFLPQRP